MLKAIGVHKMYHNGKQDIHVLKGVHIEIRRGEFVAIAGPSGAGKSTLLHIMGGLDVPTEGSVVFAGKDIYALGEAALSKIRNESMGFVFQFYHLLSEFTVLENVVMPMLIRSQGRKVTRSQARGKAIELLRDVGLHERVTHFPNQLSGGEQQRVAIARALVNNPSVLLCDEPTGNLDSATGASIVSLIKKISMDTGMTVVFVTHNLELAKSAQRLYHLRDGIVAS